MLVQGECNGDFLQRSPTHQVSTIFQSTTANNKKKYAIFEHVSTYRYRVESKTMAFTFTDRFPLSVFLGRRVLYYFLFQIKHDMSDIPVTSRDAANRLGLNLTR